MIEMANDYTEKVKALLAVAEDPNTPEEMAENYRAKAYALIAKYEIEEAALRDAGRAKIENIVRADWKDLPGIGKTYSYEFTVLVSAVAEAHDMKGLIGKTFRDSIGKYVNAGIRYPVIIGFEGDVTRLRLLVESLLRQCELAANKHMREWVKRSSDSWYKPSASEKYNERRSFIIGYGERLAERIREARRVTVQEAVQAGTSTALVLVDKGKQVNHWVAENMSLGTARAHTYRTGGMYAGRAAANSADLGQARFGGARGAIGS